MRLGKKKQTKKNCVFGISINQHQAAPACNFSGWTHTHSLALSHTWFHTRSWRVWRRIVPSKAWIHFSRSSASRAEGRRTQTHPVSELCFPQTHTDTHAGPCPCGTPLAHPNTTRKQHDSVEISVGSNPELVGLYVCSIYYKQVQYWAREGKQMNSGEQHRRNNQQQR